MYKTRESYSPEARLKECAFFRTSQIKQPTASRGPPILPDYLPRLPRPRLIVKPQLKPQLSTGDNQGSTLISLTNSTLSHT